MLIKFKAQIELPIVRLNNFIERFEQVLDAVHYKRKLTMIHMNSKTGLSISWWFL